MRQQRAGVVQAKRIFLDPRLARTDFGDGEDQPELEWPDRAPDPEEHSPLQQQPHIEGKPA
jgi:hypothetical protein